MASFFNDSFIHLEGEPTPSMEVNSGSRVSDYLPLLLAFYKKQLAFLKCLNEADEKCFI